MAGVCVILVVITTITSLVLADKQYGLISTKPGKSCRDIYQMNPASHGVSGYYIIVTDKPTFVYCDMTLECGGEKGWMRIANVNPVEGDCPNGWKKITNPVAACRPPSDNPGCFSAHFPTHDIPYSRVCGKVIGIQKGTPDAFGFAAGIKLSINQTYLDGISITYGTPRKHVWSYAAGVSEDQIGRGWGPFTCPCSKHRGALPLAFVNDHYYCESGTTRYSFSTYFTGDPLWDGINCGNQNTCCTQPSLPWFFRQLPLTNTEDIEARICYDQHFGDESVLVKEARLYVQ